MASIHLGGQPLDGQLPRGQRIGRPALLPLEYGDAVENGRLIALEVERMLVVGQRGVGSAGPGGVVRKLRIRICAFRSVLQFRLQIALSLRILLFVEVLAEAGAVVEPDLARQLLIAIRRMGDALADGGVSSKSAVESSRTGEVCWRRYNPVSPV